MSEIITANIELLLAKLRNEYQECEEASPLSKETYIPCGKFATVLVDNRDPRPYFMCFRCADHNEKNRGAKILGRRQEANERPGEKAVLEDPFTGQVVYEKDFVPLSPESTLNQLFSQYAILRADKDRLDMELDAVDKALTPVKDQIIALMVELEYQSINHDGVKYYLSVPGRPSIIPDKRADFIAWLKYYNEDGIIQPDYINSNTLWGWYNQREDEIKEELQGMLKVSEDILLKSPKDYKRTRKKK